ERGFHMSQRVQELIAQSKGKRNKRFIEKIIPVILFLIASVSVLTTIGIVLTLVFETVTFFTRVSIGDFLFGTTWLPFSNKDAQFGIWPLILGTLKVTAIAIVVAVPIGISAAIYLSEYASETVRRIVKPILEVLAGIPTIVY